MPMMLMKAFTVATAWNRVSSLNHELGTQWTWTCTHKYSSPPTSCPTEGYWLKILTTTGPDWCSHVHDIKQEIVYCAEFSCNGPDFTRVPKYCPDSGEYIQPKEIAGQCQQGRYKFRPYPAVETRTRTLYCDKPNAKDSKWTIVPPERVDASTAESEFSCNGPNFTRVPKYCPDSGEYIQPKAIAGKCQQGPHIFRPYPAVERRTLYCDKKPDSKWTIVRPERVDASTAECTHTTTSSPPNSACPEEGYWYQKVTTTGGPESWCNIGEVIEKKIVYCAHGGSPNCKDTESAALPDCPSTGYQIISKTTTGDEDRCEANLVLDWKKVYCDFDCAYTDWTFKFDHDRCIKERTFLPAQGRNGQCAITANGGSLDLYRPADDFLSKCLLTKYQENDTAD